MRAELLLLILVTASASAHDGSPLDLADAMAKASAGVFVPMQMSDGSQLWRWSGKELKGPDLDIRYADLLAQGMAKAQWCSRGWEETKRTQISGMLVIEGKCK